MVFNCVLPWNELVTLPVNVPLTLVAVTTAAPWAYVPLMVAEVQQVVYAASAVLLGSIESA